MNSPRGKTTLMILAGGTGGHVFPALAVAEIWRQRGMNVEWLGTAAGIEARIVPAAGITLHTLPVYGLRGKGWKQRVRAPLPLLKAGWLAWRLMHRQDVALALGMGGYVTGPAGLAARLAGKPLVIHEQNAVAGLSNRWLAPWASRLLTGFPGVFGDQAKASLVGNPVRASIAALPEPRLRQHQEGVLQILVLGGSQGADALNRIVPLALQRLAMECSLRVVHQCGEKHLTLTEERYANLQGKTQVIPFIQDMAAAYLAADLVICRAGALTVAELAAAGVPSLLIPLPSAVDDHQTHNARYLSDAGAAVLCPQVGLDAEKLLAALQPLRDTDRRLSMAKNARALAQPDAAKRVADICQEIIA
ncbi:MAG: undecaprenyldiphospho-muramoylpentapeptide beta-N-acetylglucosaminyltransferase [Pseudomonadales bacterium]|nr:undecaprenyldiphospho-muramoylpentapeptide beta-N-acetylglucosaminyltransferase [Pseudomonadales bacterium]